MGLLGQWLYLRKRKKWVGLIVLRFILGFEWVGQVGGSVTAGTGVVSEKDLGRTNRIEIQTVAGLDGTGRREWDRGCIGERSVHD